MRQSPVINALTNATAASVIATVKEGRLNLAATFEGFVPANNPSAP